MADALVIDREHPWPWLEAYTTGAALFFNGRGSDTQALLRCVLSAPTTVLFGKSGLGKTSLLQAGLAPKLKDRQLLPVLVRLDHGEHAPGLSDQMLARLQAEAARAGLELDGTPALPEDGASATARLWELLQDRERRWFDAEGERWQPVFILDQFEEVFTLKPDAAMQRALFDELGDLIEHRVPPEVAARLAAHRAAAEDRIDPDRQGARYLISLREDYLPDLEPWADRIPRLGPNRCRLLPMSREQALEAVLVTGGALVTAKDASRIVAFLSRQGEGTATPGPAARPGRSGPAWIEPPLLSLVCAGLNHERFEQKPATGRINTDGLEARGGSLLATFYDAAFRDIPSERQEAAHRFVEEQLITSDGTRRPYPWAAVSTSGVANADLAVLVQNRLIRTDNSDSGDVVELVHDRLALVALQHARRNAALAAQAAEAQEWQRKRSLLLGIGCIVLSVVLFGAIAFFWQWRKTEAALERAEAATRDAVAQRVLSDANDFFGGINRNSSGPQSLLMTLAGHRIAQLSTQTYIQISGLSALQREASRSGSLIWLQDSATPITCIKFSKDGKYIVTGGRDNYLRIWNSQTGEPIGKPLAGHTEPITSIDISADSKYIASGSRDRTIAIWEALSGNQIRKIHASQDGHVTSVAFSPSGSVIASGGTDNKIRTWNASSGELIGSPVMGHEKSVKHIEFSPDGGVLISSSEDGSIRKWSALNGKSVDSPIIGHQGTVTTFAQDSTGTLLISGGVDMNLRLWNLKTNKSVKNFSGHSKWISSVAFNRDGNLIASGGDDKIIRIWDIYSEKSTKKILIGHTNLVSSIAFSPDGRFLASGSEDGTLRLWDYRENIPTSAVLDGHTERIHGVAYSPDGNQIVSGSGDNTLIRWDARNYLKIGSPIEGHTGPVRGVAFSPDSRYIISASADSTLRLWDAVTGTQVGKNFTGHSGHVYCTAFSPNGRFIVSGGRDSTLRIWNPITHETSGEPFKAHEEVIYGVAVSADSNQMISGGYDKNLYLWDPTRRAPISGPLVGHEQSVRSVVFSPDGNTIISAGIDTTIRRWDKHTGKLISTPIRGHDKEIKSISISSDGKALASASADTTIRLWDVRTGTPIGEPLSGHDDAVHTVAFSPDGKSIASGGEDKRLRVWPVLEGWADQLCAKLPRNMSRKEWREWVSPDIDYIVQCPGKPIPAD